MPTKNTQLDLVDIKDNQKDYRSILFSDKDQIKGGMSDDLLALVKSESENFKIDGEIADYNCVKEWSFPIDQLNSVLSTPESIKLKNLQTNKFGLLQIKKPTGELENLLYSKTNTSYSDTIVTYRLVVDALQEAELNRLNNTIETSIQSLDNASLQINISKGEISNQKSNLEILKGKGTFFRPDNDIRNDRAKDKLNELFNLLEECQVKINDYKIGLNELAEVALRIQRWSNNLNNQPFAVLGSNIFKKMIIDPQPNGAIKATNTMAWVCLGIGGLGLMVPLGIAVYNSFAALAIASMGPIGWLITGIFLTIGTVLLIISSIQEANELKDYYEKSIKLSEGNIAKAKDIIAQLRNAQALLDKAFASVEAVVRNLDGSKTTGTYSHAELIQKLKAYEYSSARCLAAQKVMDSKIAIGKSPGYAADFAADLLSLDISDNPKENTNFSAQVYLMGYYIRTNKISELKKLMEDNGGSKGNIRKALIVTLLANSNSPEEVIERLKAIDGEIATLAEIEAVRNESLNIVLFAAA